MASMGELREPLRDLIECGLPQALEVMGERWSFMILRASFNGLKHFEEFLSELGIARNILSNRLAKLVEHGILKREPCADDRRKIEYRLTEKGLDLLPAMLALRQWGEKWELGTPSNPVLCDERDGRPIARIQASPTARSGQASVTAVGRPFATSLAKDGPERTAGEACGASSASTSVISLSVPRSIPFEHSATGVPGLR